MFRYLFLALYPLLLLQHPSTTQAQNTYQYVWEDIAENNNTIPFGGITADNNGMLYVAGSNGSQQVLAQATPQGIYQQSAVMSFLPNWGFALSVGHFNDNSACLIIPLDTNAAMRRIGIVHFDSDLQVAWAKFTPINYHYLNVSQTLYVSNNEIWFATEAVDPSTNNEGIDLFAITETGDLSQQYSYELPIFSQQSYYLESVRGLKTTNDGNFILLARGVNNPVDSPASLITVLLKITPQGDVIWAKTFDGNTAVNNFGYTNLVVDNNGGYLLGGYYLNGIAMTKIDDQANVLWTKYYDTGLGVPLHSFNRLASNDGYIGLFSSAGLDYPMWKIACFDEQGNICWQKQYDQSLWTRGILAQSDGYVFSCSLMEYVEDIDGNTVFNREIGLTKVDLNGDLLLNCPSPLDGAIQLVPAPDITAVDIVVNQVSKNMILTDIGGQMSVYYPDVLPISHQCPPPIALFQLSDTLLCPNNPNNCITVTDSSLNSPDQWLWLMPGASPSTYSGINPPEFCYNNAGIYTISLVVSNSYGSDTASYNIEVSDLYCPPLTADFSLDQTQLCINSCTTPVNLLPDGQLSYMWYANGASPDTYSGINPPEFCYGSAGIYTISLVVSNSYGSDTASYNIEVSDLYCPPPPIADFSLDQTQLCINSCTTPVNLLPDEQLSYMWYANGASPNTYSGINPPEFCYNNAGIYTIRLVASNNTDSVVIEKNVVVAGNSNIQISREACLGSSYIWNDTTMVTDGYYTQILANQFGCDSIVTINLHFTTCGLKPLIPTAFSPNGDQINDLFYIFTENNVIALQIYNRWGECVFDANDINQAWDGTYKEKPCPMGVYVWVAKYQVTENGIATTITDRGNVTLIR